MKKVPDSKPVGPTSEKRLVKCFDSLGRAEPLSRREFLQEGRTFYVPRFGHRTGPAPGQNLSMNGVGCRSDVPLFYLSPGSVDGQGVLEKRTGRLQ